ncbi:UNVERIFIED_CONTAM: hypothetical protein GTU68_066764 [Idotea baltica]|nr:hypothetical protein [Idotea baltica]
MGFEEATPIQELAIPKILEGKDLIACAQTGTGKTAAFILPIINKLSLNPTQTSNTLVIAPTRELAIQIDQQIQGFSYFAGVGSMTIYGGGDASDFTEQKRALTEGVNIIIATPGKLLAHLNLGYVKFDDIQHLILDEADRMLNMGFYDDIIRIINYLPKERQNLLFSATMPSKISNLAKKILHDPFEIKLAISKPAEGVTQEAYLCYDKQKNALINHILIKYEEYESIIIFTSTKKNVGEITKALKRRKYDVEGISSDLDQKERESVLAQFKAKRTRIIVSTDVLSRGIDIKDINLVVNFDAPRDAEEYVHRIGRTARAGNNGHAITLVNQYDMFNFAGIEELIEKEIPKTDLPEGLGEAPAWNPKRTSRGGFGKKKFGNKKGGGKRKSGGGNRSGGNRKPRNN